MNTLPASADESESGSQIKMSMPTTIPFAFKADGTIVGASHTLLANTDANDVSVVSVHTEPAIPDTVSFSGENIASLSFNDDKIFFGKSEHDSTLENYVVSSNTTNKVPVSTKDENGQTYSIVSHFVRESREPVDIGTLEIEMERASDDGQTRHDREHGTGFAVYSDDDNSLNFYQRTDIPVKGETAYIDVNGTMKSYEITEIYMGLRTNKYPNGQWKWSDYASDIEIVNIVDPISPTTMNSWFKGFDNEHLQFTGLDNLKTEKVGSMQYTFEDVAALTSIDLSSWDMDEVYWMTGMFKGCASLKEVIWPEESLSHLSNMIEMFSGCAELENDMLPKSKVDDMPIYYNRAYQNCISLKSFDISDRYYIDPACCTEMFDGCISLESLTLSNKWRGRTEKTGLGIPYSDNIYGADGYWYNCETGQIIDIVDIKEEVKKLQDGESIEYSAVFPSDVAVGIYSADDNSLEFYRIGKDALPEEGTLYTSTAGDAETQKTATKVYVGVEGLMHAEEPLWVEYAHDISSVNIVDEIHPVNCAGWFECLDNPSLVMNIEKLDTSRAMDIENEAAGEPAMIIHRDFSDIASSISEETSNDSDSNIEREEDNYVDMISEYGEYDAESPCDESDFIIDDDSSDADEDIQGENRDTSNDEYDDGDSPDEANWLDAILDNISAAIDNIFSWLKALFK